MSLNFLQPFGLAKSEADLYELLLNLGEASASKIASEMKLKRPTTYNLLNILEKKGLVTKREKNKKMHFQPAPPQKLLELSENRHHELDRASESLKSYLPALTSTYVLSVERPIVTTYEGVEGLKKVYMDTLSEGQSIDALLQTSEIEPELHAWLDDVYVKARAKKGIHARAIMSSSEDAFKFQKRDLGEARTSVIVPDIQFPFKHEVDIYGDKVAFIQFKKGEKLVGIIIKNQHIADTMRAWFSLAWQGAEKVEMDAKVGR